MATVLELVNISLRLCSQQEQINLSSTLGTLAKAALQTAIDTVVMECRHQSTSSVVDATVTQTDFSLPGFVLPTNCVGVTSVLARNGANDWVELVPSDFEALQRNTANYTTIGNSLYFSRAIQRPFSLKVICYSTFSIMPLADATNVPLDRELEPAVWYLTAAQLAVSFVDDPNAGANYSRIAEGHIQRLRNRKGQILGNTKWR